MVSGPHIHDIREVPGGTLSVHQTAICQSLYVVGNVPRGRALGGTALRLAQGIVHYPKMIASSPLTSALYLLLMERHNSRAMSRTVNYSGLKARACASAKNRDTIGRLTATLAAMLVAATLSAGPEKPQQIQQKSSLLGRLDPEMQWQIGHS